MLIFEGCKLANYQKKNAAVLDLSPLHRGVPPFAALGNGGSQIGGA